MKTSLELYIDYRNNFLTVHAFAEHYNLSFNDAEALINQGRKQMQDQDIIHTVNYIEAQFEKGLREFKMDCPYKHQIVINFNTGIKSNHLSISAEQLTAIKLILKGG